MKIKDIINKKKNGYELNSDEISFVIKNYLNNTIQDYQMSALLMAIYFQNLSQSEMNFLTLEMVNSGKKINIFDNDKIIVDKHSTGGVGDKTSIVLGPIIASFGLPFVKVSGRGLGHTGGTIDKLESIPGFQVNLPISKFKKIVLKTNIAIISQNKDIVPADGKIYSLRDATGSVENIGLIATSIMSKKIALNGNLIVIDIKCGNGAFTTNLKDAKKLAQAIIGISQYFKKKIICVISNMNEPLGSAVGNAIEVKEAIDFFSKIYSPKFKKLIFTLATEILIKSKKFNNKKDAILAIEKKLDDGTVMNKFKEWIKAQGGRLDDFHFQPKYSHKIFAKKSGYLNIISSTKIGNVVTQLGGGRYNKDDTIDYQAGLFLHKKNADSIKIGDLIFELFSNKKISIETIDYINEVFEIKNKVKEEKLILDIID